LEAAEDYPKADSFEGLDITLHQAPSQHLLPNNVHFKYLDMQEDIPAEFVGRYDLVHARFLLGLVKNNDPVPLLRNLLKLLSKSQHPSQSIPQRSNPNQTNPTEPNGYLQWNEVDWGSDIYIGLEETNTPLESSGLHRLRQSGKAFLGPVDWPQRMPEIVESQGLQDVVVEKRTKEDHPRQYASFWTEAIVAAGIDTVSKIPQGEMRDRVAGLVDEAAEDARKGIAWCGDHFVVVGRKVM
jgi:hypothetical protein